MRRPRRSRDAWSYAASRIVRAWRRQRARSRSWALSRALSEAAGEGDLRAVAFLLREKERQCLLPIGDGDAISSCRGRQPDAASVGCPQSQNDCSAAGGIRQMTGVAGRKRDLDGEPQLWSGQIDASEFAKAKATDRGDVPAAAARKEDSFGNLVVASGTETDPVADCVKYRETTPPTTVPPRELVRCSASRVGIVVGPPPEMLSHEACVDNIRSISRSHTPGGGSEGDSTCTGRV